MAARQATALLEANGAFEANPSRRRLREPKAHGIGPAPEHLSKDERCIWDEIVTDCAPGVFQSGDRIVLEQFVQLVAESRRDWAKFSARKQGVMLSIAGRFGMTPADRARVFVDPPEANGKKKTGLAAYV